MNLYPDTLSQLEKFNFVAVVAGSESGIELTDEIAKKYSLPGNNVSSSILRRNKFEMQNQLKRSNLNSINQILTDSFDEVVSWAEFNTISQFVVKPNRSGGSDSVSIVFSLAELEEKFKQLLGTEDIYKNVNSKVLVQEFVEGNEYVVDTVISQGKIMTTNICSYNKIIVNGGSPVYKGMEFLDHNAPEYDQLVEYNKRVLESLDVKWGASHSEIMLTSNSPVLIETGARLHGGGTPQVLEGCYSISILDLLLLAHVKPDEFDQYIQKGSFKLKFSYVYFLSSSIEFVLSQLDRSLVESLDSFDGMVFKFNIGDKIKKTKDLMSSPGLVYLCNDNPLSLQRDINELSRLESHKAIFS